MNLSIESTAYLSNDDIYLSKEDDFLITSFRTSIKANLSNELSSEEFLNGVNKIEEIGYILSYTFKLDYSRNDLAILADLKSSDLCYAASFFFYFGSSD